MQVSTEGDRGYVLRFAEIGRADHALVGGKGANLGELSRIQGIHVPDGFCVTTNAFRRVLSSVSLIDELIDELLDQLSHTRPDNRESISTLAAHIRRAIEGIAIPDHIAAHITAALAPDGAQAAYAVRSSATAEDLPNASFAGQQDTYLNVIGAASVLTHVSKCWASLFADRAVTYRTRNGFDHKQVQMAVVVQQMVFPDASGVLFTADPISGNRRTTSIECSIGLGEALVSGIVNADVFKVRDGSVVSKTINAKKLAVVASSNGGTHEQWIGTEAQQVPSLTDGQAVRLATLGRQIETHFAQPQDVEWCLVADDFQIVQSRPITTLFPVPANADGQNHVYISVGHQQMMTDAMKPLGLSVWQLTTPRPMAEAGGRLFVDVTGILGSPANRKSFLEMFAKSDPLISDALQSVVDRGDFIPLLPDGAPAAALPPHMAAGPIDTNAAIVAELIAHNQASIEALKRTISGKSGAELVEFIVTDIRDLQRVLFDPRSMKVIMAGMDATWWLNDKLHEWLGEKNAADTFAQSAPNNITSEMGLALLDVADVVRAHANVIAYLEHADSENYLDELANIEGGQEVRGAINAWLDKYGMRGVGEIDITRTRWSERPTMLIPIILSHIKHFDDGEAARRFEHGQLVAQNKAREIIARLRLLPDGEQKAAETTRMIDTLRTFVGYREYPKYGKVCGYFVYKQALMKEAERLVNAGVLHEAHDIFYLRIQELLEVSRTNHADQQLIRERKEAFKLFETLRPPRILTSDGDMLNGSYHRTDFPASALVGLAVSAGTVEGRARVVLDIANANLEPGDILVTAYTDPSWTPLFIAIAGLVTEVGGAMTHGAVIAREYGLPAIVGVENATRLIRDGQRIRVHGTEGYVELLE